MQRHTTTDHAEQDFSGDPQIFGSSAGATKHPKPGIPRRDLPETPQFNGAEFNAAPDAPFMQRLREKFGRKQRTDAKLAVEQTSMEERRQKVRELADELNRLTTIVEKAKTRLSRAGEEYEELKTNRAAYAERARESWGRLDAAFAGNIQLDRAYSGFAGINAALADYPEARKRLAAAVAEAESNLAAFNMANDFVESD